LGGESRHGSGEVESGWIALQRLQATGKSKKHGLSRCASANLSAALEINLGKSVEEM
jgi:hypothetical protein